MEKRTNLPTLEARFFRTDAGGEPVREWLKSLPVAERTIIGEDIKTVQFGWPLGMPLAAHLESGHLGGSLAAPHAYRARAFCS